ncbi:MAG: InlB B-repeat-containing protein [Anaeroplasmataceae bacterium]|nr:InlB B-repeat-containing protein [Anaeroplasmataceae bacterium]MDE6414393.1 InlB B-repeat-containing protein [Anaeroplasmataceae bacterium]
MFLFNGKQMKRIFMVFFLVCFFVLCSCHKQVEQPQEKPQETYSITYVINGHGEQPENLVEQTNLPDPLPILSEEGWTFEGWYTTLSFESGSEAVAGIEIIEDTILYARWKYIPTPIEYLYSITYVTNGHGQQPANLKNQAYIPSSLPVLREEGWRFEGWYLDNETFLDEAKVSVKLSEDTTLYAKWTEVIPSYVVDYKINNSKAGTLIGETHQIVYRGEDTTPIIVVPNVGYRFLGWSKTGEYLGEMERVDELTRVDTNVQDHITAIAMFQGPVTCEMEFKARDGGKVEGTLKQSVWYGGRGEIVTAIPDEGFRFVRWSDGETEAVRTNECVTYYPASTPQIFAEFERCARKFKLEYNEATSNTELTDYTFYLDDMEKEQYLPVPQREGYEFVGWYSDWFHSVQVTDETGKMIVDNDWFNNDWIFYDRTNPDMKLYARWRPIKEVPVYKILLIFVTQVHATLESTKNGMIQVDYVMSDIEREFCILITKRLEEYLEAILNGTVDFQVDAYFTKIALSEENFYRGSASPLGGGGLYYDYGINLENGDLPEVNDMLDDYDSALVSFNLKDRNGDLHVTAGHSGAKYGNIYLESVFGSKVNSNYNDFSLAGVYYGWVEHIGLYAHELTHTIELQLKKEDCYGLHEAAEYYGKQVPLQTEFDILNDYLRNECNIGGKIVGIPYEFWTGEYEKNSLSIKF